MKRTNHRGYPREAVKTRSLRRSGEGSQTEREPEAGYGGRAGPRPLPLPLAAYANSKTNSISTGESSGSTATPTALRACCPASPKISPSSSDAPLMTPG